MNPSPKDARKTIRVILAEDQGMVLGALAALLEIEGDISVIAQVRNGKEAVQAVLTHKPDVLITDIEMPLMTGLDAAAELKRLYAVYLAGHIAKTTEQDPNWRPSREFWVAWHAMELDIEALFSGRTRAAVRGVEALMTANGGIGNPADRPRKNEQDFIEAGGAAMRALYEEIGLRLPAA